MHMVIGAPRRASIKSGRLTKEIKRRGRARNDRRGTARPQSNHSRSKREGRVRASMRIRNASLCAGLAYATAGLSGVNLGAVGSNIICSGHCEPVGCETLDQGRSMDSEIEGRRVYA